VKRLILLLCCALRASAQDPFEIHVYEYEPMKLGEYSLEAHLNGASGLGHLTLEPTVGLSENLAVGFMFLSAYDPGSSPQFAGWRVLPHFYAPESWRLPFRLGFVAEFSFQKTLYEENSRRVELRPILDREAEHWQVVFNPVMERALHGPGTRQGWNFEPAVLLRWKRKALSPSLEYYGEVQSGVHQLFAGGDWQATPTFLINFGVGTDLTSQGPGLVVKSRFEWHWGK
jgi:hypothetical protein